MAVSGAAPWLRKWRAPRALRAAAAFGICAALAACQTAGTGTPGKNAAPRVVPDVPVTQGRYLVGEPYERFGRRYVPVEDWLYSEVGTASWYGIDYHGKRTANGETYDLRALTAAHPTLPLPSRVRVTNVENGKSVELRVNDRGPFEAGRLIDVSERAAEVLGFKNKGLARVRIEMLGRAPLEVFRMAEPKSPAPELPVRAAPTAEVQTAVLISPSAASSPAAPEVADRKEPAGEPAQTQERRPEIEDAADPVGDLIEQMSAKANPEPDSQDAARAETTPAPEPERLENTATSVAGRFFIQAGAFTVPENAYSLRRLILKAITGASVSINPAQVGDREFFRVRVGPFASTEEAKGVLAQLRNLGQNEAEIVSD